MKSVIVLTMPRSCSSLLAGILHRLGVNMGPNEDMIKGAHLNRYGCYENQDFLSLDMNIMNATGLLLDYYNRVHIKESKIAHVARRYRHRYQKLIKKYESEVWGFKDAALIYILPYIHDLFTNPYYIHLERDHFKTAKSIRKTFESNTWFPEMRDKFSYFNIENKLRVVWRAIRTYVKRPNRLYNDKFYEKMVHIGHNRIKQFLYNKNALRVQTQDLFDRTEHIIKNLIDYIDIHPNESQIQNAIDFVHPELLHN